MPDKPLRSWTEQFDSSLQRLVASGEAFRDYLAPSLDELVSQLPLEAEEPQLDELHRTALRAVIARHVAFISDDFERALRLCASPPERAMLYAISIVAWEWCDAVLLRTETGAAGLFATSAVTLEIEPQARIRNFRVDFLVTMSLRGRDGSKRSAGLVVECDGHDWHERTKEQARRDRARDRALQSEDLPVYRYTGSDVWRDVFAAADEAVAEVARRFSMTK